jgi:hypothetical protein
MLPDHTQPFVIASHPVQHKRLLHSRPSLHRGFVLTDATVKVAVGRRGLQDSSAHREGETLRL